MQASATQLQFNMTIQLHLRRTVHQIMLSCLQNSFRLKFLLHSPPPKQSFVPKLNCWNKPITSWILGIFVVVVSPAVLCIRWTHQVNQLFACKLQITSRSHFPDLHVVVSLEPKCSGVPENLPTWQAIGTYPFQDVSSRGCETLPLSSILHHVRSQDRVVVVRGRGTARFRREVVQGMRRVWRGGTCRYPANPICN